MELRNQDHITRERRNIFIIPFPSLLIILIKFKFPDWGAGELNYTEVVAGEETIFISSPLESGEL